MSAFIIGIDPIVLCYFKTEIKITTGSTSRRFKKKKTLDAIFFEFIIPVNLHLSMY
jgi:hypothetical protein